MHPYVEKQRRFGRHTRLKLVVFAVLLGCIWAYGSIDLLKNDERSSGKKFAQPGNTCGPGGRKQASVPPPLKIHTERDLSAWSGVPSPLLSDPLKPSVLLQTLSGLSMCSGFSGILNRGRRSVAVISSSFFPGLFFPFLRRQSMRG